MNEIRKSQFENPREGEPRTNNTPLTFFSVSELLVVRRCCPLFSVRVGVVVVRSFVKILQAGDCI